MNLYELIMNLYICPARHSIIYVVLSKKVGGLVLSPNSTAITIVSQIPHPANSRVELVTFQGSFSF